MEMRQSKCPCCGAPVNIPSGAVRVRCEYCGTEFSCKQEKSRLRDINYGNYGAAYRAYIPDGWQCSFFHDDSCFSTYIPVCLSLSVQSPDGAQLMYLPYAYFAGGKNAIGGMLSGFMGMPGGGKYSTLNPATLTRSREYQSLERYAAERVEEILPQAANVSMARTNSDMSFIIPKLERFCTEAAQRMNAQVTAEAGEFLLSFTMNGRRMLALYACGIARKVQSAQKAPEPSGASGAPKKKLGFRELMDFGMRGGIVGAMRRGEKTELPQFNMPDLSGAVNAVKGALGGADWAKCFDAFLILPDGAAPENWVKFFEGFCSTIQYGEAFSVLQEEELARVNQIKIQGMQQRTQNAINASQRVSRTLSDTSDIVMQAYEQRSAAMDNVSRMQSEAVRGVNSYTSNDGNVYEASVKYDHVYQRGSDFAGSLGGEADLGPDWTELKKR